jgi:glycosyltransferase involved in cell wall biosynthesis
MKIVCVSHACATPINQTLFASVQDRTGWDVSIVVPETWSTSYGATETERLPSFHGELVRVPVILKGNVPLHFYRASLRRVLEREAPDVVYVHHEPYALASAQTVASCRARTVVGFYSAQNLNKRYPLPIRALERYVYRRATFAFPVSTAVEDVLRAKGFAGRTSVLPLWVDGSLFKPNGAAPDPGALRIGFAGRIVPEKGLETLIDALPRVADARLVVAGEGPARATVQAHAIDGGVGDRVDWLGYVPHGEMPSFYGKIDVLVVPSIGVGNWREQFGRVVIEALACGVPVVASDSGELPRLIAATGGGLCFAEGDADDLAAVLVRLTDAGYRASLGSAGEAAVRSAFSVESVADRFAEVVAEVAP